MLFKKSNANFDKKFANIEVVLQEKSAFQKHSQSIYSYFWFSLRRTHRKNSIYLDICNMHHLINIKLESRQKVKNTAGRSRHYFLDSDWKLNIRCSFSKYIPHFNVLSRGAFIEKWVIYLYCLLACFLLLNKRASEFLFTSKCQRAFSKYIRPQWFCERNIFFGVWTSYHFSNLKNNNKTWNSSCVEKISYRHWLQPQ